MLDYRRFAQWAMLSVPAVSRQPYGMGAVLRKTWVASRETKCSPGTLPQYENVEDPMNPGTPFESSRIHAFSATSSFAGVPAVTLDDLHGARAVIVGAPFDWGTSYRPGARFGPKPFVRAITSGMTPTGLTCQPASTPSREWSISVTSHCIQAISKAISSG